MFMDTKTPQPSSDAPVELPEPRAEGAPKETERSDYGAPRNFRDWIAAGYLPG